LKYNYFPYNFESRLKNAIFINGMNYIISRLGAVMCMGVTAGAYILTLFAVCTLLTWWKKNIGNKCISQLFVDLFFSGMFLQMKYRNRVVGLILVSPLCKAPSWTEWFYNKVPFKSLQTVLLWILWYDDITWNN